MYVVEWKEGGWEKGGWWVVFFLFDKGKEKRDKLNRMWFIIRRLQCDLYKNIDEKFIQGIRSERRKAEGGNEEKRAVSERGGSIYKRFCWQKHYFTLAPWALKSSLPRWMKSWPLRKNLVVPTGWFAELTLSIAVVPPPGITGSPPGTTSPS